MEFQLSYFKSWKMMLWKCCTQYASKFGKLSSGHRVGKYLFSFQSQRRAVPKNVQTTIQLYSLHMLVRICSKSFKLGLNTVNREFPDVQAGFRKCRGTRDQMVISTRSEGNQGNSRKTSTWASLTMQKQKQKLLSVWITTNYGKFLKRWEYQTTLPIS